jgi:hypothetical protein
MPTIEEKIEASKAVEAELLARLLALPGAEVMHPQTGENVLSALLRQRETTWQLGAWVPQSAFAVNLQIDTQACAQQAPALMNTDGLGLAALGALGAVGPAPEPEPPTLVATEPPLPVTEPV